VSSWLNVGFQKQYYTIAQGLFKFYDAKDLSIILMGSPSTEMSNTGGVGE